MEQSPFNAGRCLYVEFRQLSEELCHMHFDFARAWNRMCEDICTRGEDGLLIWLMLGGDGAYSTDIARHFDLTAGRVANIVKALEDKGYIARLQDRDDLRRAKILLTETGRSTAEARYQDMVTAHQAMLERLGEEDAAAFIRLLGKALQHGDEE